MGPRPERSEFVCAYSRGELGRLAGRGSSETSILSQQITIPSNGTTLNYWYWIDSEDLCGYDHAYVRFGSSDLEIYDLCESNDTGGWVSRQVDVTS